MNFSKQERSKERFSKDKYFDKIDQIKALRKSFEYPANPAYMNRNTRNIKKLKYLSEFCRQSKIPMSNNEELIMNLDLSRM